MAYAVRRATYFYVTVKDEIGEGYRFLSRLARLGVNLMAFTAIPIGPTRTQFALFPENEGHLRKSAGEAGIALDGPYHALLVQGDDELGALASVHQTLFESGVDVYASTGVADGKGNYGYVMYVQPDQFERAVQVLNV